MHNPSNRPIDLHSDSHSSAHNLRGSQVSAKQDLRFEYHEDGDFHYNQERLRYIGSIKWLGILSLLISIAQVTLSAFYFAWYSVEIAYWLLGASIVFFIASIVSIYWSFQAHKSYQATTDLFQTPVNDHLTRGVFRLGLILSGIAALLLINLFMQYYYAVDFVKAQNTSDDSWNKLYEGRNETDLARFAKINFIIQGFFLGFYFFFYLLVSRAAFRCLKYDTEAMTHLIFIASLILLSAGLAIIYSTDFVFGYEDYPQLRANFPLWNIRGLFIIGIFLTVICLASFMTDHSGYRIGFFVLSILLFFVLVALVNFAGFAFRNTRHIYNYYSGLDNPDTCSNRMYLVDQADLEGFGCPQKYLPASECTVSTQGVLPWETPSSTASSALVFSQGMEDNLQFAAAGDAADYKCLNMKCCGLLGQLYSEAFLRLANYAFLAIIGGTLLSIGCYYFWYVLPVLPKREKKKLDFWWLGAMGWAVLVFLVVYFVLERKYIGEKLGSDGAHL